MTGRNGRDGGRTRTRRQVLAATLGAAGMVGLAGCGGGGSGDGGNGGTATATPDSGVTIGLSIPTTGSFLNEGQQLRFGYELAAKNLEESTGFAASEAFGKGLGGGILGEEVELVVENTQSTKQGARESAETLITEEGVDVFTGAASVREALAHQAVAAEQSTIYMGGFASGTTVSEQCTEYAFNEMFNSKQAARALVPALQEEFGTEKTLVQVYPRSDIGRDFFKSVQAALSAGANWRQLASRATRVGTEDHSTPIEEAVSVGPDVIMLCYYGLEGAAVLRQARKIVPDDVGLVVPLFNRPMVRNASDAIEGVVGSVHWDRTLETGLSTTFLDAWQDAAKFDSTRSLYPSGLSHLAYVQLFQYAAAAERAGSLKAGDVIAELENHTYRTGLGAEETLRACDHQAMRPVPVVRGLPKSEQADGAYFEHVATRTGVGYPCDEPPASECNFD